MLPAIFRGLRRAVKPSFGEAHAIVLALVFLRVGRRRREGAAEMMPCRYNSLVVPPGLRSFSVVARARAAFMAKRIERKTASAAIELPADEPESVPTTMAGRWIAWSADGLRIIGSGVTLKEASAAAEAAGESDPIFQRVGGARLT